MTIRFKYSIIAVSISSLLCGSAYAADTNTSATKDTSSSQTSCNNDPGVKPNEVCILITSGIESKFEQPVKEILAPVTIVTKHDIEKWQAKSPVDVMAHLPGVIATTNGGLGSSSSIYIRGTEARHTLVLIDGMRLPDSGISNVSALQQFPISLVQRIEYIRGPRSAVYGSDAIGGVINIITIRPEDGTDLTASVGSNGYQNYSLYTQQNLGDDTQVSFAGSYDYTYGYDVDGSDTVGLNNPRRNAFMNKSFYGSLYHKLNDNFSLFMRSYGYNNRLAYKASPNYEGMPPNGDTETVITRGINGGVDYKNDIFKSNLTLSYNHTKDRNYYSETGPYSDGSTLDDITQTGIQWFNSIDIGNGQVGAGIDWHHDSTQPGTQYLTNGYDLYNTGIYATAYQKLAGFTFEGAVRRDHNSVFPDKSTAQGSIAYNFNDNYRIITSYGTSYKTPSLGQLYGAYGSDPNLKPEASKQWELGFEGNTLGNDWRISGYRNIIDNLIDYAMLPSGMEGYANIGKSYIKGIEATDTFSTGVLTHTLSYDYTQAINASTGQQLDRRPTNSFKYDMEGDAGIFTWDLAYRFIGKRNDKSFANMTTTEIKEGGVSLFDASITKDITKNLSVTAAVKNITNKLYYTAYNYKEEGREYYLTGKYSF